MLAFYLTLIDDESDKLKFERIYNRYKNLLFNLSKEILKDSSLAEDAVHETFLRIAESLEKIEDVESQKTKGFLITITKNIAKTMLSKSKKHISLNFAENVFEAKSDVEEELDAKWLAQKIALLPEEYRDVLLLQYRYGCTGDALGKMLGISSSAARKRLQRARKKLGEMLDE